MQHLHLSFTPPKPQEVIDSLTNTLIEILNSFNSGQDFSTNIDRCYILIKNGANVNALSTNGNSFLLIFCQNLKFIPIRDINNKENNKLNLFQELLSLKADPNLANSEGNTPLHYASQQLNKSYIELLLSFRAQINVENNDKNTPLHLAAQGFNNQSISFQTLNNFTNTVNFLLNNGANKNLTNNNNQKAVDLVSSKYQPIFDNVNRKRYL